MLSAGELGKREGIRRARIGANPEWLAEMDRFARTAARQLLEFTANDVWDLHDKYGKHSTPSNSALGPIMQSLAKEGFIRFTGRFVISTRASQHKRPLRVWKIV